MSPSESAVTRRLLAGWLAMLLLALALRAVFPLADPPWRTPIGITWHDEGVWAHNARNNALYGAWRVDQWNPMYVSPVFTGLEYICFTLFGVGLWQARLVSIIAGTAATLALALGLRARASPGVALTGALLLATNYTWVMYSRVALLEATMVAALVAAWACYSHAERDWRWGIGAALFGLLAFFTKASAAFFLVALGLDACWVSWRAWRGRPIGPLSAWRGAIATFATLAVGTVIALVMFVWPNWSEYAFYNLFVYGSRRSSVGLAPLIDRASWFPVVHQFFTRQWPLTVAAMAGLVAVLARYRQASAGERMLALWFLFGTFELVLHDLGNERRYVFLVPAIVALGSMLLVRDRRLLPESITRWSRVSLARSAPLLAGGFYVVVGSLTRQVFMPDVRLSVRSAALVAIVGTAAVIVGWPRLARAIAQLRWSTRGAIVATVLIVGGDLSLFARWAWHRTEKNYQASVAIGRLLPAGTVVQGKLANGVALDSRIRPLFIGPGFGNFTDRLERSDVSWILTYTRPSLGYEGAVIRDLLDQTPGWQAVAEFPVAETPSGDDRIALVRKPPR